MHEIARVPPKSYNLLQLWDNIKYALGSKIQFNKWDCMTYEVEFPWTSDKLNLKYNSKLLAAFKELDNKDHSSIYIETKQPSNASELIILDIHHHSPKNVTLKKFALDDVYNDYEVDKHATDQIMPNT